MHPERLTRRRFAALLESRGPLLDTWPQDERDAALALLARSAVSRRLLADRLADHPAIAQLPGEDGDLAMRLRAGMWQRLPEPRSVRLRRRPGLFGGAIRVGALAASFALGAWIGIASVPMTSSSAAPELFASVQTTLISPDLP
jgi:hypothetical protein